ncbi:hypothetical protein LOAG_05018 [Loa loa]|uniref:Uncharacterized protein n=1 Tax=Loa loa TaxID=7209 RepID=A0A1S0U0V8_LOALO|nr:hypothetical protein LOAG_05018 [Loa loa]EFO23471.1 hypothetical protein LOAG_05018 [Loa loa]
MYTNFIANIQITREEMRNRFRIYCIFADSSLKMRFSNCSNETNTSNSSAKHEGRFSQFRDGQFKEVLPKQIANCRANGMESSLTAYHKKKKKKENNERISYDFMKGLTRNMIFKRTQNNVTTVFGGMELSDITWQGDISKNNYTISCWHSESSGCELTVKNDWAIYRFCGRRVKVLAVGCEIAVRLVPHELEFSSNQKMRMDALNILNFRTHCSMAQGAS